MSDNERIEDGSLTSRLPVSIGDQEEFDLLYQSGDLRIERIVSTGQSMPDGEWYDQVHGEWVLLYSGAARLRIEGEAEDRVLAAGDWLFLPAHCRHRVTWTQRMPPAIWLAIHMGPRDG